MSPLFCPRIACGTPSDFCTGTAVHFDVANAVERGQLEGCAIRGRLGEHHGDILALRHAVLTLMM